MKGIRPQRIVTDQIAHIIIIIVHASPLKALGKAGLMCGFGN